MNIQIINSYIEYLARQSNKEIKSIEQSSNIPSSGIINVNYIDLYI